MSKNGVKNYKQWGVGTTAHHCGPTIKKQPRKCYRLCIKVSSKLIVHAWCCNNEEHGHNTELFIFRGIADHGPTKYSAADSLTEDGVPAATKIIADELIKRFGIKNTV